MTEYGKLSHEKEDAVGDDAFELTLLTVATPQPREKRGKTKEKKKKAKETRRTSNI